MRVPDRNQYQPGFLGFFVVHFIRLPRGRTILIGVVLKLFEPTVEVGHKVGQFNYELFFT
jgi:hypothetical protein